MSGKPTGQYLIYRFPKKAEVFDLSDLRYAPVSTNLISSPDYKIVLELAAHDVLQRFLASSDYVPLGDITISTQGLSASRFQRQASARGESWYPFLEEGQVYRYVLNVDKLSYAELNKNPSLKRYYEPQPKLLVRRIVNREDRLMATYTDQKLVFTKDINPFVVVDPKYDARYVLGIINSKLISYLYINTSSIATKDDFRQTTLAELRRLPVRAINVDEPIDRARHDRMVSMVERMFSLKQEYAVAEAMLEDRRHDLAREIEELDAQIDQLVYELYGLTEEEIAIVEAS